MVIQDMGNRFWEYQEEKFRQVANLTVQEKKTPVDVYIGILRGDIHWVRGDFTLEEAAFGAILPYFTPEIKDTIVLSAFWEMEVDIFTIYFIKRPTFEMVVLTPIAGDNGKPYIRLTVNHKLCQDWLVPHEHRQYMRKKIITSVSMAIVQNKPVPLGTESLLRTLSNNSAPDNRRHNPKTKTTGVILWPMRRKGKNTGT